MINDKFWTFPAYVKILYAKPKKNKFYILRKKFNKVQYGSPPPLSKKKEGGETTIIVMQLGKPAVENLSPFSDLKMRVWF